MYGFAFVRLGDIAKFSTDRITAEDLNIYNYVGVDNLLPDKRGKINSVYVPKTGRFNRFNIEDVLIGNIRPYLKKIWFADCDGGTNGDVLVFRVDKILAFPKYIYHVLSCDRFFNYDMQYAKGAKMPRGNKVEIMKFLFALPPLKEQNRIVKTLDRFDKLCNDISEGLPAEIEARQKQYEYYRDKLLKFKEKSD